MYFTSRKLSNNLIVGLKKAEVVFNNKKDCYEVKIPQLDRQDYEEFKQVLEEIHGKWNHSANAHVFESDPTEMLNAVIEVGCFPQRKPHDAFFTPPDVVDDLLRWGGFHYSQGVSHYYKCLEPSAGHGFIIDVLRRKYPGVEKCFDCCEIDGFNRDILQRKGYNIVGDNFLQTKLEPQYHWVIMNPPFNGKAGDYIAHIEAAFELLLPGRDLLAIVPESFLTSQAKRVVKFRNKVFTYGEHANLPDKVFAESGTQIKCCMIKMQKYSPVKIQEFETPGYLYDYFDLYTGQIIVSLTSESEWFKRFSALVNQVEQGRITTKDIFLKEVVRDADDIVLSAISRHEASFRWDDFTKQRLAEYFLQDMIDEYLDGQNPFQSTKPRQLSLF
jgi:hypothetical protein